MSNSDQPGTGFFGWLGRQVGHVRSALRSDAESTKRVYRDERIDEREHPDDPNVKLRRTTIDEVIVHHPSDDRR